MRRKQTQNSVEMHRVNILKSLEHRLQVAQAQGDEKLIRQLETEKSYYN